MTTGTGTRPPGMTGRAEATAAARRLPSAGVPRPQARERRLLLLCGRVELDDEQHALVRRVVRAPLDWDAVLFHARLHSVAPLLYRHLDRLDLWEAVPDHARTELLRLHHRTAYQNRIFAQENRGLLLRFEAAAVPVIVQKGLSLVETVYGGLDRRPLIDLIFLMPERRVPVARQVLARAGYRERRPPPAESAYRWCCPQRWFVARREMKVPVLVQWSLVNWPRLHRFGTAPLWEAARPALVTGARAYTLDPVDQVVYLCLQAAKHGAFNAAALGSVDPTELVFTEWTNNRLVRFTDLWQVIRHHRKCIDWDRVVARARESGVEDDVFVGLALTNALLGTVVGEEVLEALRPPRPHPVRSWVLRALSDSARRGGPERRRPSRATHRFVRSWWFRLPPRRRIQVDRVVQLAEFCVPPAGRLRLRYGLRSDAATLPLYPLHAGHAAARSIAAFAASRARRFLGRRKARLAAALRRLRRDRSAP